MHTSAAADRLAYQLPADAYYQLIHKLRLTLPPPLADTPENLLRRDHDAITRIAGLCPANAAEADVAAQFVAASEQWKDCLRLVQLPETTPERAVKYRAQAATMMRESKGALRLLLQMQDRRRKLEADNAVCHGLAWTEHAAMSLMIEALSVHPANSADVAETPPPQPGRAAESADSAATPTMGADFAGIAATPHPAASDDVAQPSPAAGEPSAGHPKQSAGLFGDPAPPPASDPQPLPEPAEESEPDPILAAELYAAMYPERAALIRRLGRLPADITFGPPDDEIVEALVTARTPALAALDRVAVRPRAA